MLTPPRMRMELPAVESYRDIKIGKEVHARAGAWEKVAFRKGFSVQFIG